ncbi:TetR/AcrR family transcriptional regulator C-terminal domain-containing protein [Fodinibacter luteus]|uniref:TetR/AcrR family transcriptional regulator C-terminal domain-containing protein n=1 Tax=Fodinibacter luteus TaxID=552064 RepID=A0ABP8KG25_9MICO
MPRRRDPNRPRRQTLTRERVLQAALVLADERGIDALSMRELGRHLGVDAMSLYNHVDNKDDLLNGIIDLVVGEIDLPPGDGDWSQAMRTRARSAQAAFTRHPWASQLLDSRTSSGPERLRYFDWVIGTLRRAGFTVDVALHAYSALDSYIYGFARQQANLSSGEPSSPETAQQMLAEIPTDQFPHLTEVITHHIDHGGYDPDADFDFGLTLILDSLARLLDDDTQPDDPAR